MTMPYEKGVYAAEKDGIRYLALNDQTQLTVFSIMQEKGGAENQPPA
jgi:hypothetical protein